MRRGQGQHSARDSRIQWWRIAIGVCGIAAISALEIFTDQDVSFAILYPLPILWIARTVSTPWGVAMSVFSAMAWSIVDTAGAAQPQTPVVSLLNFSVRLGAFLLLVGLESRLQRESANARTDPLTELLNRRGLEEEAQRILRDLERGQAISVAFFDLDNFKMLNDRSGHHTGDEALKRVGRALQRRVRSTDVVARVGGDEFVVLLRLTGFDGAVRAAEHIRNSMESAMRPEWGVGVTGGLAFYQHPPESVNALLAFADSALYQGKRAGGNRVIAYRMPHGDAGDHIAEIVSA